MVTSSTEQLIHKLEFVRDTEIAATMDVVFETILEQLGSLNVGADREPIPMKLEPWPGGRWFRDLGNNRGHLWAHVQSIRPNDLLELQGPTFMSAPVMCHMLYRLSEERGTTRLKFSYRAVGQIPPEHLDGVGLGQGWSIHFEQIKKTAERKK